MTGFDARARDELPDRAARQRPLLWTCSIAIALAGLVLVPITLARLEINPAVTAEAGRINLRHLWAFWLASGFAWLGLSGMAYVLWRRREVTGAGPRTISIILFILATAAAARGLVIFTHEPALSDDLWRYIYDGRNLANGINPYLALPEESIASGDGTTIEEFGVLRDVYIPGEMRPQRWAGERTIAGRINNPELHSIYLPTSQIVFLINGTLAEWLLTDPADPQANARLWRITFALIDLVLIGLLLRALIAFNLSPWWAAVYAWHPLVLTEFAGSGHQDVVGIALVVAALLAVVKKGTEARHEGTEHGRATWLWSGLLAFAGQVKPHAVVPAVFILRGRSWRAWMKALLVGLIISIVLLGPLLIVHGGKPIGNLRETASRFTLKWAHFGGVYEPLLWSIERLTNEPDEAWERPEANLWTNDDQERAARLICLVLLIAITCGVFLRIRDPWRATRMFMFAAFLLSPAAHPWYLVWALALWVTRPSLGIWIASLTVLWGYAAWGYVQREGGLAWGVAPWLLAAAYVPVYLAIISDLLRARRDIRPETVSSTEPR